MIYGSVCSGIEAATVAWHGLGWRPAWFAEIDPFARAVLAHRFPEVRNLGDFTTIRGHWLRRIGATAIDLLVGGTPCQSFSVAGKRLGLDDPRGNLTLEYLRLAARVRPRWLVWENVPGVLSIDGGRTFGAILGALAELGYGFAYRILDAQYFGVPQRRRRVFVVGYLGAWQAAAAVLFERESLRRDTPARRKTRQGVAALTADGVGTCGADDNQAQAGHLIPFGGNNTTGPIDIATACNARGGSMRMDFETETFCVEVAPPLLAGANQLPDTCVDTCESLIAHTLRAEGMDASEDGTGRGTPLVAGTLKANHGGGGFGSDPSETFIPMVFSAKDHGADAGAASPTLRAMPHDRSHANAGGQIAVCIQEGQTGVREYETAGTVRSNAPGSQAGGSLIRHRMAVRRLTPRECERLQGFPDDWTLVPNYRRKLRAGEVEEIAAYLGIPVEEARELGATPDGPRYKAIGNSMAVPVMKWIGHRIDTVDRILREAG